MPCSRLTSVSVDQRCCDGPGCCRNHNARHRNCKFIRTDMKTANSTIQMARDIRELINAGNELEAQNQELYWRNGDTKWYPVTNAKIKHNNVHVQTTDGNWFLLREYRKKSSETI